MNNSTLLIEILILCEPFRNERFLNQHYGKDEEDMSLVNLFHFIQKDAKIEDLEQFQLTAKFYKALKHKKSVEYIKLLDVISSSLVIPIDDYVTLRQNEFSVVETGQQKEQNSPDIFSTYNDRYKILIWYYFSRFISMDLLTIAYLACHNYDIKPYIHQSLSFPKIYDKLFNKMISEGIAETHVHLNGSVHYEVQFWYLVCKRDTLNEKRNFLSNINDLNKMINKKVDLEMYLLMASIIRFYLCEYIHSESYSNFEDFIQTKDFYHLFYDFLSGEFHNESKRSHRREEILTLLEKIERRVEITLSSFGETSKNEFNNDYLSLFYVEHHLSGKENEYFFLYECIKYIKQDTKDTMFFALFRRYIIIKNILANYKIQGGTVKGFTYFHYFFSGQKGIIPLKDGYQIVLAHYSELKFVRRLELRKSFTIPKNASLKKLETRIAEDILLFLTVYKEWLKKQKEEVMSVALIYHFTKKEEVKDCCVQRYLKTFDERVLPNGLLQSRYEQCIIALKHLFDVIPNLKQFVVGIDAASDENKSEPSVFSPLFLLLRNKYRGLKPSFYNNDSWQRMEGIGFTYHVGEVFNVLISGYRHIDEVITQFRFQSGDRLGHATALMVQIDDYLRKRQSSKVEAGEQLKNLLYLFHLKKDKGLLEQYDLAKLINEIQSVAYIIFEEKNIDVQDLYLWYESTFEFEDVTIKKLKKCELPCMHNNISDKIDEWKLSRLVMASHCKYYKNRMRRIVCVEESIEMRAIYHEIQKYLMEKVQSLGIIIESNPISNSRIGEISSEFEIPIRNMNTHHLDEDHQKRAMVTISSDDPAVFNTNIIYQYYLLQQQLINQGFPKEDVLMWLNQIRKNGMYSSFINHNLSKTDLLSIIKVTINEIQDFLGKNL